MGKTRISTGRGRAPIVLVAVVTFVLGFYLGTVFIGVSGDDARAPQPASQPGAQERSGGMQEQIKTLERRVQAEPTNVEAWTQLGHLYFDTDQPRKAIEAYTTSLDLAPDNPDVLTDMGVMYRQIGKPEEAIGLFERALRIEPDHRVARFNKGIVLLHDLGDREGAISAWEEVIARDPQTLTPSGQPLAEVLEQLKRD
jgi:cytochrome c-type biogenesis protein CcmH/NrfG